jgi:nitrogenase molybdenum-iron protein alpha chain
VRTFSQSGPGETVYALKALGSIPGSVTVIHGGSGCASAGLWFTRSRSPWYSSNLNESDTILGGDQKLRAAILRAFHENHPEVIFIIGTPVNAINNDDVDSVALELEDELGCTIVYVEVNNFRTKDALSGYDAVFHAFLKRLVQPKAEAARPFVNLFSVSESPENIAAIAGLLERLAVPCNLGPASSGIQGIKKSSAALCGFSLDDGEAEYFLTGLEEQFGAPFVRTNPPIGSAATSAFIRNIAGRFNRGVEADAVIQAELQTAGHWIDKKPLADKTIFLETSLRRAVSFCALIAELGGTVSGIAAPCVDAGNSGALQEFGSLPSTLPVIIGQGSPFELANVLAKHPADLYIGPAANALVAARAGVRPLATDRLTFYGFEGIRSLAKEALKPAAGFFLAGTREENPYSDAWLGRSGNWYVKMEVT